MSSSESDLHAKIDEYHLMIEEVLGGMDIMMTKMERRLNKLEKVIEIQTTKEPENSLQFLQDDINKLKTEITEGFNLAFRKINEK
jgi:hypothetical protein